MRKICLVYIILLFVPLSLIGQEKSNFFSPDKEEEFFGGLTLGGNFSTVDGDSYAGYSKVGLVGGGVVYARLFPKLYASIELLYTQKGSRGVAQKTSIYSGDFFERYWLDLNYIEIPLAFHYVFTPRLHVGIGGAYAQLIGYSEEIYTDQPVTIDPDANKFNTEDFNFVLNAGWQIGDGWFILARYQRSVRSIREPVNIPIWQNSFTQFNDLFSLRLLYLIK